MSNRKKKKINQSAIQKIAKAQQRNEFISRLKDFCDKISHSQIFKLIPKYELEKMYDTRCHPVKVIAGQGQGIPPEMLKEMREITKLFFKSKFISLKLGENPTISLYDFFTVGYTLMLYSSDLKEEAYPTASQIKKALIDLTVLSDSELRNEAWQAYNGLMLVIEVLSADIGANLYYLKQETRAEINGIFGMHLCLEVYAMRSEKIQVVVDNVNRPAFRIGWIKKEPSLYMDFVAVNPTLLKLPAGEPFAVYIQSHALNRLTERMAGVPVGVLHFNVFESFKNPKVCKNKKGDFLFEFRIFNKKVGYFKGDIVEGRIILRTFLFLTNNGTPEGEKLHENTGLMKEDKIYLAIDKLSTFVESDIETNDNVKEIFIKAGCESLFEIDKSVYFSSVGMKEKSMAMLIAQYLKIDDKKPS